MKIFLLLLFLFINTASPSTSVYVCRSTKAKKYHLRVNCHGLSHCSHRVVKMKLSDAEKEGRTLCGFEK